MFRWLRRFFRRPKPRTGGDVANELDNLSCDLTEKSEFLMSWTDWRLYTLYLRESDDKLVAQPSKFCGRSIRHSLIEGESPSITYPRAKDDRTFQSFHPEQSFRWQNPMVEVESKDGEA